MARLKEDDSWWSCLDCKTGFVNSTKDRVIQEAEEHHRKTRHAVSAHVELTHAIGW
jgi:hypothetical protein